MDNEQLEKRIKWLDDERRKDKAIIAELEDRLHKFETKLKTYDEKDREFESDLTRLRTSITKVDSFEDNLDSFQAERKKATKDQEKLYRGWINDAKKDLRTQLRGVETQQKKLLDDFDVRSPFEHVGCARVPEGMRADVLFNAGATHKDSIKLGTFHERYQLNDEITYTHLIFLNNPGAPLCRHADC